jgi:hypothetical protein
LVSYVNITDLYAVWSKVLRRMYGWEGVTWEWRKLHKEELYNAYSSPNIIRAIKLMMRWEGHIARMGDMINSHCRWTEGV